MLSPTLLHIDERGRTRDFSLAEAFFNPALVEEHGISGFLRGLATQPAQEIDLLLVDEVRNVLFGAPGAPPRDLAALNIQRNRDHGLPDYNSARIAYGLPPARTFAAVSSAPNVQGALNRAYRSIDKLDLWAGGLAEDHVPGAMLGETFRAILADQFRRLRDGDRYWYERDPYFLANPGLLAELRATTLADVIRRNTPIGDEIPDRVFGPPLEVATEPDSRDCLRGRVAPRFSLVVYDGGSVEDLTTCAAANDVTAVYLRDGGEWISLIVGAPDFVNQRFRDLFPEGVPPLTPLVVSSDGPSGEESAEGN